MFTVFLKRSRHLEKLRVMQSARVTRMVTPLAQTSTLKYHVAVDKWLWMVEAHLQLQR
jgi:hypothetical protein